MALETKLLQKQSQNLLMTPQLQHAIKLLQLGRLEYKEAIENELLENPILEELKESDPAAAENRASTEGGEADLFSQQPQMGMESETPQASDPAAAPESGTVDWEHYLENMSDTRGAASPRGTVD